MKRPLTETEKMVVSRMAETLADSDRSRIAADLACASAELLNDDGSIIRFDIANYSRMPSIGRHVTVDGTAKDRDGAHLNIILFTDENDRLYELEIVRFEDGNVIGPDWTTLKFY